MIREGPQRALRLGYRAKLSKSSSGCGGTEEDEEHEEEFTIP
jgi:hypothetical protein